MAMRGAQGRAGRMAAVAVAVIAALALSVSASASAAVSTRPCGNTTNGYPVSVRASRNVKCTRARRIIAIVYGEGPNIECYSRPGVFDGPCIVLGYHCTMRSKPQTDISSARCTDRNELITGKT